MLANCLGAVWSVWLGALGICWESGLSAWEAGSGFYGAMTIAMNFVGVSPDTECSAMGGVDPYL